MPTHASARLIRNARDRIDAELLQHSEAQNLERLAKALAVLVDMAREVHVAQHD